MSKKYYDSIQQSDTAFRSRLFRDHAFCCNVNLIIEEYLDTHVITGFTTVPTCADLPDPALNTGEIYAVLSSTGSKWIPSWIGGTFCPKGFYISNGVTWDYLGEFPTQASQAEVDAGVNTEKFVNPATFANAAKWSTKQNNIQFQDEGVNQGTPGQVEIFNVTGAGVSIGVAGNVATLNITAAAGAQGFQGSQGDQGAQGNQGFQGAVGAQGSQGSTGAQGVVGAQGFQGANGANGAQGAQGSQGSQGATGAQGAAGSNGAQGAQGFQGDQGATGAQGANGAQGSQGSQGAVGAQGSAGAQGFQGHQGSVGAQGDQGATGSQGSQGANGAQGSQGFQGSQGNQGAQGSQGNQGFQGVAGATGSQGSQGNQGLQGAQGSQGNQGVTSKLITFGIYNNGSVVPVATVPGVITIPYSGTISSWYLSSEDSCTATVDIWKNASAEPTNSDSITASAKPGLSAAQFNNSSTLTGWITSISAGDKIKVEVEQNDSSTYLILTLVIT